MWVAVSRCARMALLAVLVVLAGLHHARSLTVSYNATNCASPPPPLSQFDHLSPFASQPAAPPAVLSAASTAAVLADEGSSILTVRGCAAVFGNGTTGCGFDSVLTIAGSGFTAPTVLEVARYVNCSLADQAVNSSALIVSQLCPYYWPQQTLFDLRVITNNTSASLPRALSFVNTAPVIARLTSDTCTVPPYNGCDPAQSNFLTVTGRNFLSSPNPLVNVYIWLGQSYLPCWTLTSTLTEGQFVCVIGPFRWTGSPPAPSQFFDVLAGVVDANWLRQEVVSNILSGAISFSARASSSSSSSSSSRTGTARSTARGSSSSSASSVSSSSRSSTSSSSRRNTSSSGSSSSTAAARSSTSAPIPPIVLRPTITRVSGCEDGFNDTRNCPFPYDGPITLTIYGTRFRQYAGSMTAWVAGQRCLGTFFPQPNRALCSWNTSAVNYSLTGTSPLMVSLNTTAGWVNVSSAVSVDAGAEQRAPAIEGVSGCASYDGYKTRGCERSMTLTLWGTGFARYLPASLLILSHTIPCGFPDLNPLMITCPLQTAYLADLPRDVDLPVQLRLGGRLSEPVPYVALAVDGPPVVTSSSGGGGDGGGGGGVDADELVGMKLAFYVSQYGQAAVDSREVLLQ